MLSELTLELMEYAPPRITCDAFFSRSTGKLPLHFMSRAADLLSRFKYDSMNKVGISESLASCEQICDRGVNLNKRIEPMSREAFTAASRVKN